LYYLAAVSASLGLAVFEYVLWLSIAGHDTVLPVLLRCSVALGFGVWAAASGPASAAWWPKFLAFALPQFLLINIWAVLSLVATPTDPATLPFLFAVFGLSLADFIFWISGWAGARRIRSREVKKESTTS
jgi:hypothetical protein